MKRVDKRLDDSTQIHYEQACMTPIVLLSPFYLL